MNRLVYLFELDSVKKTTVGEIRTKKGAIKPLYSSEGIYAVMNEIVKNGNSVAVTLNQLTDSQFFSLAINDEKTFNIVLSLFERGKLRVSLYNDVRTASQYFQQALEKVISQNTQNGETFIFSNLPVQKDDEPLLTTLRDALRFSDLSKIQALISSATDEAEKIRLTSILRFIKLLLAVSVAETGNVLPKTESKRSFSQFMTAIIDAITTKIDNFPRKNDLILAVEKLKTIRENIADTAINNRSNWLTLIDDDFPQAQMAKDLIHLGYNYTLEDSVSGASKHYDDEDFENSFSRDLICKIKRLEYEKHEVITLKKWRSCWKKADRISRLDGVNAKMVTALYEKDYLKERSRWRRRAPRKTAISLLFSLAYALLFRSNGAPFLANRNALFLFLR